MASCSYKHGVTDAEDEILSVAVTHQRDALLLVCHTVTEWVQSHMYHMFSVSRFRGYCNMLNSRVVILSRSIERQVAME